MASIFCACKSEYHIRLEQAKELRKKMIMVEASNNLLPRKQLIDELKSMREEIEFLAKVSGNEELFLKEVYAVQMHNSLLGSQK